MNRYFVASYTDGPVTDWQVIDRKTQDVVCYFRDEQEAVDYAQMLSEDEPSEESGYDRQAAKWDHDRDLRKHS